jgi:hypothetical protein
VYQCEGRARDGFVNSESFAKPLSESGFAGTHFARQNNDVSRATQLGDGRSDTMGVGKRANR